MSTSLHLNSLHLDTVKAFSHIELLEQLHTGTKAQVFKGIDRRTQQAVIVKLMLRQKSYHEDLIKFRQKYERLAQLQHPNIVVMKELMSLNDGLALIMPDNGAIALSSYIQLLNSASTLKAQGLNDLQTLLLTDNNHTHGLPLDLVLNIAIQLTEALQYLFEEGFIHKDIKPANIIIHPQTHHVQLIDFNLASRIKQSKKTADHPENLEGTLAYLAPEQTGRMNRCVDYRCDYYSLGITLFELLTGQLPFNQQDPMSLLHSHIAQTPPRVDQIKPTMPKIIGNIIEKLLSKNAEQRYQSSTGLQHDLKQCLQQLQVLSPHQKYHIESFPLAQHDRAACFLLSDTLHGREKELATVLSTFEQVTRGAHACISIAGPSGIGKTAIVHEVHKPIAALGGRFISGKFDQFQQATPFYAIKQALKQLIHQVLTLSDHDIAIWKNKANAVLGPQSQFFINIIPDLHHLIGSASDFDHSAESLQDNNHHVLFKTFQDFVLLFAEHEHPLVLFLDDMQWADQASLELIESLLFLRTPKHLLFITAYRDNEINACHPWIQCLNKLQKTQHDTTTVITVKPLQYPDIEQLVADNLKSPSDLCQDLAKRVYQFTRGNPFFATQLLLNLYKDQVIEFEPTTNSWSCDLDAFQSQHLTDNVVDLMLYQLRKLPSETQDLLTYAAFLGNTFDISELAACMHKSEEGLHTALWPAIQEGLIHTTQHKSSHSTVKPYRFLHDRVQQAAYALVKEEKKAAIHLHIGQTLYERVYSLPLNRNEIVVKDTRIFQLTNHYNLAIKLLDTKQTYTLAIWNCQAAQQALNSKAHAATKNYCTIGLSLLNTQNCWSEHYDLMLQLNSLLSTAALLLGDFEQVNICTQTIEQHAIQILDKIPCYKVQMQADALQSKYHTVLTHVIKLVNELNINVLLPKSSTSEEAKAALGQCVHIFNQHSIDELLNLPSMTDSHACSALAMIMSSTGAACSVAPLLLPHLVKAAIELCINYGNSNDSPHAYLSYAVAYQIITHDVSPCYDIGRLAYKLTMMQKGSPEASINLFLIASYTEFWKQPIKQAITIADQSLKHCLSHGKSNHSHLGYVSITQLTHLFLSGEPLQQVRLSTTSMQQVVKEIKCFSALNWLNSLHAALNDFGVEQCEIKNLHTTIHFNEIVLEENDLPGKFYYNFYKMHRSYLFNNIEDALMYCHTADHFTENAHSSFVIASFNFYRSLIYLKALRECEIDSEQRENFQQFISTMIDTHEEWSQLGSTNFSHRYYLLNAEQAHNQQQHLNAIKLYEKAIFTADKAGFINEAAIACELQGVYFLQQGLDNFALNAISTAYRYYCIWGAKDKSSKLIKIYGKRLKTTPYIASNVEASIPLPDQSSVHSSVNVNASISHHYTHFASQQVNQHVFDTHSILQATQALSQILDITQLIASLSEIILTNSGASTCTLILPDNKHSWRIMSFNGEGRPEQEEQLCTGVEFDKVTQLPVKLIQYVKNTQETLRIHQAQNSINGLYDDYLTRYQPQSLLCTSIKLQGEVAGLLYLENQQTKGVFTDARLQLVHTLCTQAAISFKNVQLYQTLERRVEERTAALNRANERLSQLAITDALTGLHNRRYFDQYAQQLWQEALREQQSLALLLFDVDDFKAYNDHYGHQKGDQCLQLIAKTLQNDLVKENNIIARYGGEEFIMIIPKTSNTHITYFAQNLLNLIQEQNIPHARSRASSSISISIGIWFGEVTASNILNDAIHYADKALYTAKANGRNQYYLLTP